ncbi:MAG: hypothetical protein COA89_15935 [Acidithiobacillus sp.]|nr:MAG: hypothetical protein COA89_15935 [Acidithiobacillus sp.]
MEPMVSGSWRSDSQGPYNGRYPRHIWSVDFVHDKLSNGRSYKMLTVIDEYTREALCVTAKLCDRVVHNMGARQLRTPSKTATWIEG